MSDIVVVYLKAMMIVGASRLASASRLCNVLRVDLDVSTQHSAHFLPTTHDLAKALKLIRY